MSHFPLLTVLVLVPAGVSVVVAALPRHQEKTIEAVALLGTLVTLGFALAMAVRFRVGIPGYQLTDHYRWISDFGISWYLGVDGISLFLVLLTAVLFPIAMVGTGRARDAKSFAAWMLLLESACLGSFLSLDVFLFFVFFELTLVPMYFIIGGWGFERRGSAAVKFFLYTFLGSALMLVGLLTVVFIHQHHTGHLTFNLVQLEATPGLTGVTGIALFLAFLAAFAVKAPIFPLHTWSPDAYGQSPTAGVVVLAGVMAKLGTYGIIRFDFTLFPRATVEMVPVLLTFAVVSILYGAGVAAAQRDLKRLVAYSSLSGMGFITLGLFALTSQGLSGSVLQMLNHGLYTAALFLLIGMIYERRGTWQLPALRGLQRPAPLLAGVFTVAMMAAIGLPGLNGFVGEFLILLGTFLSHRWWAVAGAAGVVAAAIYLLWAFQQAFWHRTDEPNTIVADLSWTERAIMLPLVAFIVFLGVYPRPILERITPSVDAVLSRVEHGGAYVAPRVAAASHGGHRVTLTSEGGRPTTSVVVSDHHRRDVAEGRKP